MPAVMEKQTVSTGKTEEHQKLEEYLRTDDVDLRNELLMDYLYIVRRAAVQLRGILKSSVEEEDLINQGVLALMECLERYDGTRGAKFETYAFIRVRGALIDYIRKQDWIPHRTRRLGKQIDQAYMEVANEKLREPSMEEVARHMEMPVEKLDQNIEVMNHSVILSFENVLQDLAAFSMKSEPASMDLSIRPEASLFQKEIRRVLAEAIDTLTEKERLVITLYYYEELKYAQIAEVMGVGESRVCQLHTKAILKLKIKLEEYRKG